MLKDCNDFLVNGKSKELISCWFNAKRWRPKGVIGSYAEVAEALRKKGEQQLASYPFSELDTMTYGIRSKELILFKAQQKIGKTEVLRAIEAHLLKTTDANMGIIHLEEDEKRTVQGLVTYELEIPCHLPDSGISVEEQINAYQNLTKRDDRVFFYAHFGSDDPEVILENIRYMVGTLGCKFVFLDHITMVVTGFEGEDERKKLDYISTKLAMMTRELDFTLFLVSHVNDNGDTRGSRNIAKVADLIIKLDRDLLNPDEEVRNKLQVTVEGNRFSGKTGPTTPLVFDAKTYTLKEEKGQEYPSSGRRFIVDPIDDGLGFIENDPF